MSDKKLNFSEEYNLIEELLQAAIRLTLTVSDTSINDPSVAQYNDKFLNINDLITNFHSLTPIDLIDEIEDLSKILTIPEDLSEIDFREKNIGYHIGLTSQKLEKLRKYISVDPTVKLASYEINQKEVLKNQSHILLKFEEFIKRSDALEKSFSNSGYAYEVGDEKSEDPKLLIQVIKEKTVFVTSRASDVTDNLKALRAMFQLSLVVIGEITNSSIRILIWLQSKLTQAYEWVERILMGAFNEIANVSKSTWESLKLNIAETANQISIAIQLALSTAELEANESKAQEKVISEYFIKPIQQSLFRVRGHDIAIKMGASNTTIYVKGYGMLLNQPSAVAYSTRGQSNNLNKTKSVYAVGLAAKEMFGRTPAHINAFRPMKNGVIENSEGAVDMLIHFFIKLYNRMNFNISTVVICAPSGATFVERRQIQECAKMAGAKKVYLVDRPMIAALGAGVNISKPEGVMTVDIGAGTTEVCVMALDGVVYSRSVRLGGDRMDDAIIQYLRRTNNFLLGELNAERTKKLLGSARFPSDDGGLTMQVSGRDLTNGVPREISVTEAMIAESLAEPVEQIIEAIKMAIESTPPELASDIVNNGIMLTGGGALLGQLPIEISASTGITVSVADNPLMCAPEGAGMVVENLQKWMPYLEKNDPSQMS